MLTKGGILISPWKMMALNLIFIRHLSETDSPLFTLSQSMIRKNPLKWQVFLPARAYILNINLIYAQLPMSTWVFEIISMKCRWKLGTIVVVMIFLEWNLMVQKYPVTISQWRLLSWWVRLWLRKNSLITSIFQLLLRKYCFFVDIVRSIKCIRKVSAYWHPSWRHCLIWAFYSFLSWPKLLAVESLSETISWDISLYLSAMGCWFYITYAISGKQMCPLNKRGNAKLHCQGKYITVVFTGEKQCG